MRLILASTFVLVTTGLAQAQGLRIAIVDAESGKPVVEATVTRWVSQWQPRILLPPGKFWFPEKELAVDAGGRVAIGKIAADDWYAVKAAGFEEGSIKHIRGKFQFTAGSGGNARDLAEESGVGETHDSLCTNHSHYG